MANTPNFCGRVHTTAQDNYNTPVKGWVDILKFIPKDQPLWLPFYNDGSAKLLLKKLGYENVYHEKKDFFTYDNDGLVLDNPPYYHKKKFIQKLFDRGKPFALLFPLETMERKYFKGFKKNFQIVIPSVRYCYADEAAARGGDKNHVPFKSCWFCWGMSEFLKTKDQLIFL